MKIVDSHDFWKWAFSDFMSNSLRGILAEYIVACALNCTDHLRKEWDAFDLKMDDGTKIEVKSSGYLQSWHQDNNHSAVRFDIGLKKAWDAETNTSLKEPTRSADIYVFSVFSAKDKVTANPLDLSQWFFLVCSSKFLNEKFGMQKTIGLSSLEKQGLVRLTFNNLKTSIKKNKISNFLSNN